MGNSEKRGVNSTHLFNLLLVVLLTAILVLLIQLNNKVFNTNKFLAKVILEQKQNSPVDLSYGPNDIIIGQKEANVDVYVFTSYRCQYCDEFFKNVFPALKKDYIDEGLVKIIIKNIGYPNDSISLLAVKTAYCAYGESQFFNMHMKLLEEYDVLTKTVIMNWLEEFKIDSTKFISCLENEAIDKLIINNRKEMRSIGARGTPAFVIGDNTLNGNRPIKKFRELIEAELEACCE